MQKSEHSASFSTNHFVHPERSVVAFGIEHGMRVADFGSGSGAYVLAIAQHLSHSGHVVAVDIQRDLLQRTKNEAARHGYKNVDIVWGDLEVPGSSKIADTNFDRVLISNLLFQVEEKSRVLEEARRVLKKNGRLIIMDWTESFGGMGPHKRSVLVKSAARELAEKAGFVFEREFSPGAHHYGLIFTVQ